MKKGIKYVIMFILLLVVAIGGTTMEASATETSTATTSETVRTGTIGNNSKVQWSYDESIKTLRVTGEDSGLSKGYMSPFKSI